MTIRIKLPNLVSGVARTPPAFTEASRPTEQINMLPHPTLGLMPRPGSEHIAALTTITGPTAAWHITNTREDEQYVLVAQAHRVQVFDLAGEQYPVNMVGSASSYLQTRTGGNAIRDPEDFAAASWSRVGCTAAPALGVNPFGTGLDSTAIQITDATTPHEATLTQDLDTPSITMQAFRRYTASVYVRFAQGPGVTISRATISIADESDAQFGVCLATFAGAAVTLTQGVVESAPGLVVDFGAQYLGAGWARLHVTIQPLPGNPALGNELKVVVGLNAEGATDLPAPERVLYLFGARFESGTLEPSPYLSSPIDSLEFYTVKDTTFVLNKNAPVRMADATTPGQPDPDTFYLWVRRGAIDTQYQVTAKLADATAIAVSRKTYQPGGAANDLATTDAEEIAGALAAQITATGEFASVTQRGSVIKVVCQAAAGKQISELFVSDGQSDTALVLLYERVRGLEDLPLKFFDGAKFAVGGDDDLALPDWYVEFEADAADAAGFGEGDWFEALGFGVKYQLDAATMPHVLRRKQDDAAGTETGIPFGIFFDCEPFEWDERTVGDDDTAPVPSFVSTDEELRTIRAISIVQNRLALLSDDNATFSESGVFTNLFRTTTRDLPAADPFDQRVSSRTVAANSAIIQTNGRIFLRSPDMLTELRGEPAFTFEQMSALTALEVDSSSRVEPVALQGRIYLVDESRRFVKLTEVLQAGSSAQLFKRDATQDVLDYIDGRVDRIVASDQLNMLALLPYVEDEGAPYPTAYVYSFFWEGTELLQSAFWKLELGEGDALRCAEFIENALYIVVERNGVAVLERIVMDPELQITEQFMPLIDGRIDWSSLAPSFGAGDTTATLPYEPPSTDGWVFVHDGQGAEPRGEVVEGALAGDTLTFPGVDLTAATGWVGRKFARRFALPELRPKEPAPQRGRYASPRTQVQVYGLALDLRYALEARAVVTVDGAADSPYTYSFTQSDMGDAVWRVPARGRGSRVRIELSSEGSPYQARPAVVVNAEYLVADYTRGRRSQA